jgi:hypothetical protein
MPAFLGGFGETETARSVERAVGLDHSEMIEMAYVPPSLQVKPCFGFAAMSMVLRDIVGIQ